MTHAADDGGFFVAPIRLTIGKFMLDNYMKLVYNVTISQSNTTHERTPTMTPTRKELRKIAIGAVCSELRHQGRDPKTESADTAYAVLDNLYRMNTKLLAAFWYGTASNADVKAFVEEWDIEKVKR